MSSCKLSEIPWKSSDNEKFFFDNENICMIFSTGELNIIEYGANEVIGTCRTEFTNPHLISVRLDDPKRKENLKIVAYLVDKHTIQITNLLTGFIIATISHDCRIDWLELSSNAQKILYRDKKYQLYIFDIATQVRTTLCNYCNYVQVPLLCLYILISVGA
jgi:intraflagellar transport protein 172